MTMDMLAAMLNDNGDSDTTTACQRCGSSKLHNQPQESTQAHICAQPNQSSGTYQPKIEKRQRNLDAAEHVVTVGIEAAAAPK